MIIAVNNTEHAGIINKLFPVYKVNEIDITFHKDPNIQVQNNKIVKNFDILLDFDVGSNNSDINQYSRLLGNKFIKIIRYPKSIQQVMLANISDELGVELILPKTWTTYNRNFINATCKKCLIKMEYGACGYNQVLIDTFLVDQFITNVGNTSYNEIVQLFPTAIFTKPYFSNEEKDKSYFNGHDFLVQEFFDDIEKEYRVIVVGDNMYIREREIHDNSGFKQANLDYDVPKKEEKIYHNACDILPDNIINVIRKLNLIIGSVDVFTYNGNFGIFEFSPEFALSNVSPQLEEKILNDFLEFILNI